MTNYKKNMNMNGKKKNFEKEKDSLNIFLGCVGVGMSFSVKAKVVTGKRYY